MGGGKSGGGSSGSGMMMPQIQPSPYEQELARISGDIYNKTDPVRNAFIEDWMGFLRPPTYTQTAAAPTVNNPNAGYSTGNWSPGQRTYSDSNALVNPFAPIPANQMFMLPDGQVIPSTGVEQTTVNNAPYFYIQHDIGMPVTPYGSVSPASSETAGPSAGQAGETRRKYDPYSLPGYAPIYDLSRKGLEEQYNIARQNIIGGTARGGLMSDALRQLEQGRAESVGSLPAEISTGLIQDIMNKAYGASWNAPSQSISGLSAANAGYSGRSNAAMSAALQMQMQNNALAAQQAQSKGSGLGMLGMGMGNILGMGIGPAINKWG